ncbi:hypothetical protein RA086_10665 [Lactiplantibacillus sp. WILCCON 0030]|uniref:Uncharacterized protein n=1 Tax=Lactiplantibacillus brownii TaxID=3069269 RepID=A0ABU1AAQ7_9LACO|nr:hypothetical protein [Lactiplantibacillus brownii]MDQ7938072.1 hypothetical protein [Lactiplantibacillus brownii]
MAFSSTETDYLTDILTTQLFTLLSRVTRWQTHSLSQKQYDQQVVETLTPNVEQLQAIAAKLAPTVGNQDQFKALQIGIDKLVQAQHYQLTEEQLSQANERRLSRHRFR